MITIQTHYTKNNTTKNIASKSGRNKSLNNQSLNSRNDFSFREVIKMNEQRNF